MMKPHEIQRHVNAIERDTREMDRLTEEGDQMGASIIWDGIKFRKQMLAKQGVVVI